MNEASILDIISPVMVGPSSSHTAGAVRIGLLARNIYGDKIEKVKIILYNSYASTGPGHGTDKGIVAGLLGFSVDNTVIKDIFNSPECTKIDYRFEFEESFTKHPNSVDIIFSGKKKMLISAQSVGGGEIRVVNIDNCEVNLDGKLDTILVVTKDEPGAISKITDIIQKYHTNIASLNCSRYAKGENASCTVALDSGIDEKAIDEIKTKLNPSLIRYIKKL